MQRDINRWEYMEKQDNDQESRNEKMRLKYKIGLKGNGSAAYNVINMEYEHSPKGNTLKGVEQMKSQRAVLRGQFIQQANHPAYDPINGSSREHMQGASGAYIQKGNGNMTPYLDIQIA